VYDVHEDVTNSGTGTNLKVGGGAPVRRQAPEKNVGVPLHFLALKVQLVVFFVSAFTMVSTVWSVSCLLFYSRCPASYGIGAIDNKHVIYNTLTHHSSCVCIGVGPHQLPRWLVWFLRQLQSAAEAGGSDHRRQIDSRRAASSRRRRNNRRTRHGRWFNHIVHRGVDQAMDGLKLVRRSRRLRQLSSV